MYNENIIEKNKYYDTEPTWTGIMYMTILVLLFASMIIILMIISILHQMYLVSYNITTNECLRSRLPQETFDKGCMNNWREIWNEED